MALSWSNRRKFLYSSVLAVLGAIILYALYLTLFTAAPTCFDGEQNNGEVGVDCGGSCALLCVSKTRSPIVRWSRVFEVAPGTYTAAAYVENPNTLLSAAAKRVSYSFQLFDEKNLLITERIGTIDIPPVKTVPFVDPNISVGNRIPARALFAFSEEPTWYRVGGLPVLRIGNQFLSADASQLSATVTNESNETAEKVVVTAVLFDKDGVARAASKSVIPRIQRKGSQDVTFTWSGGVRDIVRAEMTVLPSF